MKKSSALKKIMYAKSIAVIGASNEKGSVGNEIIKRLTSSGFDGRIFPVNLHDSEIEGIKAYKNIKDIKKNIDFAIIVVPSHFVLSVIDDCYKAGVLSVVVISAGFKESGVVGEKLELELMKKIRQYKMCMIGPNCLGVMNLKNGMNATFTPINPARTGKIGFVSQSGALASGVVNIFQNKNFGFSQIVSVGNQSDIDYLDVIEFWEDDESIKLIMVYVEGIKDVARFNEICSRVGLKKPIIMLKAGRSEKGKVAVSSHTGALAGEDASLSSVIDHAGVIRENYLRDFINTAQVFNSCNLPKGNNIAILTNAGGPGIIATDSANDLDLPLADLEPETIQKLKKVNSELASVKNPVDIIASATLSQFTKSADILLESKEVDILLVIYLYLTNRNDIALLDELNKLKEKYPNKALVAVFQTDDKFYDEIKEKNDITVPVFNYGIDALKAVKRLVERKQKLSKKNIVAKTLPVDKKKVLSTINNSLVYWKSKNITSYQALKIFTDYGIPVAPFGLARNLPQAKKLAEEIGYPIVLKISSREVVHKSEVGGVVVNIKDVKELKAKWEQMMLSLKQHNAEDGLEGVVVMKHIGESERQFAIGATCKEGVGNMLMFGLGGIFVEALNEVNFTPCPLNLTGLEKLLNSNKVVSKFLGKIRNYAPANKQKVAEILIRISQLIQDFDKIAEIDANPLIIDKSGRPYIIDARIILK